MCLIWIIFNEENSAETGPVREHLKYVMMPQTHDDPFVFGFFVVVATLEVKTDQNKYKLSNRTTVIYSAAIIDLPVFG